MKKLKLVVSDGFIRGLFSGVEKIQGEKRYKEFILHPPSAYMTNGKPVDDLSSMLDYLISNAPEIEKNAVLEGLVRVAGLGEGLEEIFFGFMMHTEGVYIAGHLNCRNPGRIVNNNIYEEEVKEEALKYLKKNEDKPALLIVDEITGKMLDALKIGLEKLYFK